MKPAKVALVGLGRTGLDYLDVLQQSDKLDVVAVADADPAALRAREWEGSFRVYEDYRSLIVESAHAGLDLLVVATEPYQSSEFLSLAVDRGVAVFHKSPFARTVREGRGLVERFEAADCPFVVAREWYRTGWPTDADTLKQRAGHVHAAFGEILTSDMPDEWRGDSLRAGGGVLLNGAYAQIDLLVTLLGLPESVYAVSGFARAPGNMLNYDTEDTALVILRWAMNRSATLVARRGVDIDHWRVTLAGTHDTLYWSNTNSVDDRNKLEVAYPDDEIASQMDSVVETSESESRRPGSTARDHLATVAVIESAYLSAKTGAPEVPSQLLG